MDFKGAKNDTPRETILFNVDAGPKVHINNGISDGKQANQVYRGQCSSHRVLSQTGYIQQYGRFPNCGTFSRARDDENIHVLEQTTPLHSSKGSLTAGCIYSTVLCQTLHHRTATIIVRKISNRCRRTPRAVHTWRSSTTSLSSIPLLMCRDSKAYDPTDSRYGTPSTTRRADRSSAGWLAVDGSRLKGA